MPEGQAADPRSATADADASAAGATASDPTPPTAPPTAPGLFEVQLVTANLARMSAFYGDVVGLKASIDDPVRGRVHFVLGTGQLILARTDTEQVLGGWPGLPPQLYGEGESAETGPALHGAVHFALHADVEQCGQILERIAWRDGEVRGPLEWPTGHVSYYFRDPDGNCVELIG